MEKHQLILSILLKISQQNEKIGFLLQRIIKGETYEREAKAISRIAHDIARLLDPELAKLKLVSSDKPTQELENMTVDQFTELDGEKQIQAVMQMQKLGKKFKF